MIEHILEVSNMSDPALTIVLKGHKKPITGISFHPSSNQFATSSKDGTLMVWNPMLNQQNNNGRSYNYIGHKSEVTGVEYSPDAKILASCSTDSSIRFWTPSIRGDCIEFNPHLKPILCLNFSDDSERLISGARDKAIKMWDVETKHFISSFIGHNHWVRTAKFFPNGKLIASGADDRTLRIWDVLSGQCINCFTAEQSNPVHVAPYQNNNSVAVAMSSGSVRIYDLRTSKLQQHYVLHSETTYVSWHPFDNYLLTCGKEGKVRIVDVMEGRPIYTIGGHEGGVSCAEFSSDGEYFASGGEDNYVMVWKTNFTE